LDEKQRLRQAGTRALFTVTRPRQMRILTTSFRPMIEASWG
jgi:hypothetical protein